MKFKMKQELEQLLSQHDAFLVEGELNKNKLAELARQYNPELLNLLMSNEKISQHFFATLETGVLIFKKDVFLQFLNNKEFLPDSFTSYKTKIGLATGDKYLSENQEVVLNFPYKDCVLEGGQTKDDAKRQEIFFNETLAPTEINRLLDNMVSNNQPHLLLKNVDTKPFPRNWNWLFLFLVPFLVPSWKTNLLHYPGNLQIL